MIACSTFYLLSQEGINYYRMANILFKTPSLFLLANCPCRGVSTTSLEKRTVFPLDYPMFVR